MKKRSNNSGFSLVELMVVVAIIGILAALAVPRFRTFQAKARQSEAKANLSHLYTLQESYHADNDTFANAVIYNGAATPLVLDAGAANSGAGAAADACRIANPIGFQLTDCSKVRYNYGYTAAATSTTFTGQAIELQDRVFRNCAAANDTWTIDQDKVLTDTDDALGNCM